MHMQGKLLVVINQIRFSYWFLPALMAFAAVALALAAVALDRWLGDDWAADFHWISVNGPEGARALLSTIAGSMITVAGVTFSITVAAVASATNHFGPLLVTSFLQDRGNQITLGVFIATFLYCLLVLQTVANQADGNNAFVPQVALFIALVMTLASIGVLIYFIHHVPQTVHVSHLTARVGRELLDKIGRLFPETIGEAVERPEDSGTVKSGSADFDGEGHVIPSRDSGYIQQIDGDNLMRIAREEDLVIRIECRPGSFVGHGKPLVRVLGARVPDKHLVDRINATFTWDVMRSPIQDVMFLVTQLVQIGSRALSPGVNDPLTAMSAVDWLSTALADLAKSGGPESHRADADGTLRVVAEPTDFSEFVDASFGALRTYICADRNAALHAAGALMSLAGAVRTERQRESVLAQSAAYKAACHQLQRDKDDLERLDALFARFEDRARFEDHDASPPKVAASEHN